MRASLPGAARRRTLHLAAVALACCLLLEGCGREQSPGLEVSRLQPPTPPSQGIRVASGGALQRAIDAAPAGSTLVLADGLHQGPVLIRKVLRIHGPRSAVLESRGSGSTVTVKADGVSLMGFCVRGSGSRFDLLDSAVRIEGKDVTVEGLLIREALFGILVEKSEHVLLRGNRIIGSGQKAMGLRGDGVRLWETSESVVEHNHITGCRDMVVWYSSKNELHHNAVSGSRYGTHFMYSHDNMVHHNQYVDNIVGIFVMYTRGIHLHENLLARASGAGGMGIGVKESGNLKIWSNLLLQNTTGVYLDTSPLNEDHFNEFRHNHFRMSDTAVVFHGRATRNTFRENTFKDNRIQVRMQGGGDAQDATWVGNCFDDYQGYDMDADGVGDVPYELRRLSSQLTSRYRDLAFFRGTPSLGLVDLAGHVMPLFQPDTVLVDREPRMQGLSLEWIDAR